MELDQKTLADLSIFSSVGSSVFKHFDFTVTNGGREELEMLFLHPAAEEKSIRRTQETLQYIQGKLDEWPTQEISNGTLMVTSKFLEATEDPIPLNTGPLAIMNSWYYRLVMASAYSLIRYSMVHIYSFFKGLNKLQDLFLNDETPVELRAYLERVRQLMNRQEIKQFMEIEENGRGKISIRNNLLYGHYFRYRYRHILEQLCEVFYKLDAYYSMAMAAKVLGLNYPEFINSTGPVLDIQKLYHPLLKKPIAYDVNLDRQTNFLFLTGANMAGKSTFIKAVGLSVFLAHLGMGVPAEKMELSFFDGLLTNIQVQDNIFQGESYFFNEVQRIKKTVLKINDGRKWLILIDEMFKGTNFQDAKHCSVIVIEGLIRMKQSLFVLSTHLYEIAETLKKHPNITFRYFETSVVDEVPQYSYQIKEGISNDRLGFLILKKEKVVELLDEIGRK